MITSKDFTNFIAKIKSSTIGQVIEVKNGNYIWNARFVKLNDNSYGMINYNNQLLDKNGQVGDKYITYTFDEITHNLRYALDANCDVEFTDIVTARW